MTAPRKWAAIAFAVYVAAIVLSNLLISHVGMSPVGFGLTAPAGVWAAAVSFPARDVTQRLGGRRLGVIAILAGAAGSMLFSSLHIAIVSAVTYLLSEGADMAVYTRLQRGARALSAAWFVAAVFLSGLVAIVVDSVVFLQLAHHFAHFSDSRAAVGGLILGKFWVITAAAPAAWGLRRKGPVAAVTAQPEPAAVTA